MEVLKHMKRTAAEINAQNEEFINKIIGEQTQDFTDLDMVHDSSETESIDNFDNAETLPVIATVNIPMTCGIETVLRFTAKDIDDLMPQIDGFKALVEHFHIRMAELFAGEYQEGVEVEITQYINQIEPNAKYPIENDLLRMSFKLTDCITIWTNLVHMLSEKLLMSSLFETILGINTPDKDMFRPEPRGESENEEEKDNENSSSEG